MSQLIYIVRHGNTFDKGDTVTRVGARTDLALSQSGRAQAEALAIHFATIPVTFARVLASPLKRTRETAEAILARQNAPAPLEISEFLREIDYGPDENQPEAAVVDRIGQAALDAWESEALTPPGWEVEPDALIEGWNAIFAEAVSAPASAPLLVVTSNGIARFALLAARQANRSLKASPDLKLKTGAYGILEINADGLPHLAGWNIRPSTTGLQEQ